MGMKEIANGVTLYESGQSLEKLYLIGRGSVKVSFPGGSFVLKNGDIVGLSDINFKETFLKYETLEKCTVMEYPLNNRAVHELLSSNRDATKYFLQSLFHQISEFAGIYKLLKNEFSSLKDYLETAYTDYGELSKKLSLSPAELTEYENVMGLDLEDFLPDWITGYYSSLKDMVLTSKTAAADADFLTGLITKSGRDIREMVSMCGEIEAGKADILSLIMNENCNDIFELYLNLYPKAVKKLGLDDPYVGQIYRRLNGILLQAKTEGLDEEIFYMKRKATFNEVLETAKRLGAEKEDEDEIHSKEQAADLKDSLIKILEYGDLDEEMKKSFIGHVKAYKNTVNKNGAEDDIRTLRHEITKEFNEIYLNIFEKAASDEEIPVLIKMFFNFGYVDEELVGMENAVYLYSLTENMKTAPEKGVYSYFEWLMAIHDGDKDPGRNEFDNDFADYLHEAMRNHSITKADEKALFRDPMMRVEYELQNVFPSVDKTTTGRITTFCPLLSEHNMLKDLESMLVTEEKVTEALDNIRAIDFGAYYRETVYAAPESGVSREIIDVEVLPDIILAPNIGNRGIMWQEIEGKRRTTPARMFVSIFQQEDLNIQLIRLTGQFRWEMCKRVQGARWNDISERSLTSEYFDYVQYYRKNNDLTPEAKDKIKNDMVRSKNSFREMFIRDYQTWIQFESNGSPRLNKVARGILFTYIPFAASYRERLSINPMYRDLIEHYETKQKAKIHRMDNLIKKINNMGYDAPDEIEEEFRFLNL